MKLQTNVHQRSARREVAKSAYHQEGMGHVGPAPQGVVVAHV